MPRHLPSSMSHSRLALAALLLGSGVASAGSLPPYAFSGFGTLGYAVLDDEAAEYRIGKARDGADDDGSFAPDTRLGLQLDVEATPRLSVTLQGVAREGGDGDPEAGLEWAFARWLVNDSVALRVGRLALPAYGVSDYRQVGYANVLLRPPEDVYVQVPLVRVDGIDLSANTEIGETLWSAQLFAGQTDETLYSGIELEARDAFGLNLVAERGPVRLRLSHLSTRLGVDSGNLERVREGIAQVTPFLPALADIADDFSGERVRATFDALGLSLDFDRVFLDAEYTRRRVDSWIPDVNGWYVRRRHPSRQP